MELCKPNQTSVTSVFNRRSLQKMLSYHEEILLLFLLIFPPVAYGAVEIWSVTVVHVVVIVAATLFTIQMAAKGQITLYRTPVDLLVFLFLILAVFSVFLSVYPYASRIALYKILSYIAIFYLVINIIKTQKQLNVLIWAIVLFGSLFATAALTMFSGEFLGFKVFTTDNYITLTFVNRNHFAGYLEMVVWLCVGLALVNKGPKRILLLCLAVYIAVAIFFSLSRGGILGFLAGSVFIAVVFAFCYGKKKNLLLIGSFLFLVLSVMLWLGLEPVINRMETLSDPALAGKGRLEYWTGTLNMIAAHPWFGTGLGTYAHAFPRYQTEYATNLFVNHAHNDYLELTAEMGICGFLTFVSLTTLLFVASLRKLVVLKNRYLQTIGIGALASCFSLLIHSFTDFNFHIHSNAILFVVCAAIVILCTNIGDNKKALVFNISVTNRWKMPVFFIVFLLSTSAIGAVIIPYLGNTYLNKAKEYKKDKNYDMANVYLEKAIFINRGNAKHYAIMGDLKTTISFNESDTTLKNDYLVKAVENYDKALKICPVRGYYFTKKAFALQRLHRNEEAGEAFKQAVYYSPMSSYTHYDLASYYYSQGKMDKACGEYKKILKLDSRYLTSVLNQLSKAGKDYEYIKQIIPEDAALRKRFAGFLFKNENNGAGIEELAFAFDLEPTAINALAHVNGYYRVKEYDKAMKLCKEYIACFKKDFNLNIKMANIYLRLKDYDKAKEIYDRLLEEHPANATLFYYLANYYRTTKNPGQVLEYLKQAVFLKPENINYCYQLGREYKNQGLLQLAAEQLEKCLETDTGHVNSKKALARIKEMLGVNMQEYK